MKKISLFLALTLVYGLLSAQSFRTIVVEWDDTVTVRDVSNLSIYKIVNSNYIVNSLPVPGLNPELEVFVYRELSTIPPVDYRLFNVLISEGCIDSLDATWSTNRIYARDYSIIARDTTELFESVEQEENLSNFGVFPYEKQFKYMLIYLGYLERKIDGLSIPAAAQSVADKVNAKQNLVYQNYINSLNLKQSIRNEENFDIDLGWNNTDPE